MNFFNSFLIHKNLLDFSTNAQIPSWHWVFNLTASWLSQKFQAHLLRKVYIVYTKYYLDFMSYSTKGQWNTIPRISQISKKGEALLTFFFSSWLREEKLLGLFHVHCRPRWREKHLPSGCTRPDISQAVFQTVISLRPWNMYYSHVYFLQYLAMFCILKVSNKVLLNEWIINK